MNNGKMDKEAIKDLMLVYGIVILGCGSMILLISETHFRLFGIALIILGILGLLGGFPQIRKVNYKRYGQEKGKERIITHTGYCYYIFINKYSPQGFKIPFTLKTQKVTK